MPREIRILTPENIEIKYYLAGLPTRLAAFFHDTLMQVLVFICSAFLAGMLEGSLGFRYSFFRPYAEVIMMLFFFAVFWFYHVFFDIFWEGQSPGKYKYGIRVVTVDGQQIGFYSSLLRNLLRVVDFLPLFFLVGAGTILISNKCQRLGDLLAQTVVIREREELPSTSMVRTQPQVEMDAGHPFGGR